MDFKYKLRFMMAYKTYKYTLEKYNGRNRYRCPQCQKDCEFTRYIDTETGAYLADFVGKCNRENKCGYHYPPRQYFQDNPFNKPESHSSYRRIVMKEEHSFSFHEWSILEGSLNKYDQNFFYQFLARTFGEKDAQYLAQRYYLGTSKKHLGKNVFWLVDQQGNVRGGKIMLYNPETGKRRKDVPPTWVHSVLKVKNFHLRRCLFGEHLLQKEDKSVGIVESEKTAMIMTVFYPDLLWMATGGKGGLNNAITWPLKGRKVILYPDLGAFDDWKKSAAGLISNGIETVVSDLLENIADDHDRQAGYDIADYCLKQNGSKEEA